MDIIRRFVNSLDGRIFSLNLSDIFTKSFLFGNSDAFQMKGWLLLLSFLFILISYLAYRYFTKPRERFSKFVRFELKRAVKLDIYLGVVLFLDVLLRMGNIRFLNWRFWELIIFVTLISNWGYFIYRYFLLKRTPKITASEAENAYQKYLPKKKKKR
ncbi:MAG: hypothetical protein WCJ58_08655 [bacterium]